MRLIDGDVLIEKFNEKVDMAECLIDERTAERFATFCALADAVEESHTVDAVPVVRCRECKFGSWDSEPDDAMVCVRTNDGFWRSGNDFCSRGERKEGANNG